MIHREYGPRAWPNRKQGQGALLSTNMMSDNKLDFKSLCYCENFILYQIKNSHGEEWSCPTSLSCPLFNVWPCLRSWGSGSPQAPGGGLNPRTFSFDHFTTALGRTSVKEMALNIDIQNFFFFNMVIEIEKLEMGLYNLAFQLILSSGSESDSGLEEMSKHTEKLRS